MKVLIAGATGAIGIPLSRALRAAGHEILGITRSSAGGAKLKAAGVQPYRRRRDGPIRSADGGERRVGRRGGAPAHRTD